MTKRLFCMLIVIAFFVVILGPQKIKAEPKPDYLVLVSRKADKTLYDDYVLQRTSKFNMIVLSLEELGVLNNASGIKNATKKMSYPKGTNLAIDSKVKPLEKMKVIERYVNGNIDQTNEVEISSLSYLWEAFNVGIVSPSINFPPKKKERMAITAPVDIYNRYTVGICCETGIIEHSKELSEIANTLFMPTDTYFETRGTYECKTNPIYPITNFMANINLYGILYVRNTREPVSVFGGTKGWEMSRHDYPTTAIWNDKDENKHVDNYNAEITTERYWDGKGFQGLLISDTIKPPNFNGFCITRNDYQYTDIEILRLLMSNINEREQISVTIQNLYKATAEVSSKRKDIFFKDIFNSVYALTWVLYGPPEMALTDFIEMPKIMLKPNSLNEVSEPEINFDYSLQTVFTIANIGIANLKWHFSVMPDWISINPVEGENVYSAQTEVILTIKKTETDFLCVAPQEKYGLLILSTNDPARKEIRIRVKAKGYFPNILEWRGG